MLQDELQMTTTWRLTNRNMVHHSAHYSIVQQYQQTQQHFPTMIHTK